MKISIAGAGAGKTTKIADKIIHCYSDLPGDQNIYCIAYTNSAAERIQSLLKAHYSVIPIRIKVSTIHSFLYQEFIKPYYYLLFHKQYEKIINIKLPSNPSFRNFRIAEMEEKDILVVDVIPERAKWVIAKKSDDKKREKDIRELIQSAFSSYCGAMFVDEAQDIEKHFYEIIRMMESMDIPIELMGDPKQDLKGYNYLRKLTDEYPENVESICECHRCPQKHLGLSNSFIRATEKQESCKMKGDISVIFESECSVQQLIEDAHFDLVYISHKNDRFETHQNESETSQFDILYTTLTQVLSDKFSTYSIEKIERFAYIKTEHLLSAYKESNDPKKAMYTTFSKCHLEKPDYVKIIQLLQQTNDIDGEKILVILCCFTIYCLFKFRRNN